MNGRDNHSGFSLFEILVALAFVSLSVLALLRLELTDVAAQDQALHRLEGLEIAQAKLAEIEATGFPALGTQNGKQQVNQRHYRWQTEVTNAPLALTTPNTMEDLRKVNVRVIWQQGAGSKQLDLFTYVANRALP
ncbi:MAG: type II secretion system protein [Planctomycetes bacterium]|nr:type II secretion system protein [Planctomycetota bacterium]